MCNGKADCTNGYDEDPFLCTDVSVFVGTFCNAKWPPIEAACILSRGEMVIF